MAENKNVTNFDETVQSLFKGMTNLISTKTVVGDAVHIDDTIILPLVDVSFGMGAGSKNTSIADKSAEDKRGTKGAIGGAGVKMSPSAVLVIRNGVTRLVNIKNQDTVTKVVDMIPDLVDRFKNGGARQTDGPSDEEVIDAVNGDSTVEGKEKDEFTKE